ncbi:PH domain-containing protein [Streptacidiphilus albus]|uniref:PH domain-containing protein n=1 Tax=Streptacidiphilus albus TaxID=105425 RepID=UPI00054B0928|nr:PH domain-containing protein [Streptacidiphilus albus]
MSDPQDQNRSDQHTSAEPAADPRPLGGPDQPFADRVYRSTMGAVAGGLLIVLILWLFVDTVLHGHGRDVWLALSGTVCFVPLLGAYTMWPCVRTNAQRLVVRNPLRTITVPWAALETVRATLSVEMEAEGRKFQLWAIPVSLRQRKRSNRQAMKATTGETGGFGLLGRGRAVRDPYLTGGPGRNAPMQPTAPSRALADAAVDEILKQRDTQLTAQGEAALSGQVQVAWTWWIIAPIVGGAIALAALLIAG